MAKNFSDSKGRVLWDRIISSSISSMAGGALVTLASKIDSTRDRGFRVLKMEGAVKIFNLEDNEFLLFGVAAPNLADSEILEAILADPQSPDDRPASERAQRPVFPLAYLGGAPADGHAIMPFEINLRWSYPEGQIMNYFVFNIDDGATGLSMEITIMNKIFGVWLND